MGSEVVFCMAIVRLIYSFCITILGIGGIKMKVKKYMVHIGEEDAIYFGETIEKAIENAQVDGWNEKDITAVYEITLIKGEDKLPIGI